MHSARSGVSLGMNELISGITTYVHRVVTTYNPVVVIAELLLIGLAVWWVSRFLRGTRGARLIKGFGLVFVTVYILIRLLPRLFGGESAGWDRAEFLYSRFLFVAFVALIVAFQSELRRALIQLGHTSVFRSKRTQAERLADLLVESAGYLSRNKMGSIVAVERAVGLAGLMESGVPLDARPTAELLNTIFYPGSMLHDMGVVITNGRIGAAGCQFPLAESGEVDASMGARHRAALGLAQESDALVIVVSEETGRVSLAYDGQLYLGLTLTDLREMILDLLVPSTTTRKHNA